MMLKVAFAYRVANMIAEADKVFTDAEFEALSEFFPRELLDGLGFVDENEQYTDVYHKAVARSLEDLPDLLGVSEKLGLITLFVRMCYADGALHPLEAELIRDSAAILGLSSEQLDAHLQPLFS